MGNLPKLPDFDIESWSISTHISVVEKIASFLPKAIASPFLTWQTNKIKSRPAIEELDIYHEILLEQEYRQTDYWDHINTLEKKLLEEGKLTPEYLLIFELLRSRNN